jgi:hypothetical protein
MRAKTTKYLTIALLAAVLAICAAQAPRSEDRLPLDPITGLPPNPPPKTHDPSFGWTTLAAGGRTWELEDLYRTAAVWLAEKEHAPEQFRTNATVTVYLQNKEELCMFTFSYRRHFLGPFWQVTMGYDGKVRSCIKGEGREGDVPEVKMPPPPQEPPPPPETRR